MDMEKGIKKIGNINGIDIYYDEHIGNDNVLIGSKGTSTLEQEYIWIPTELFIGIEGIPLRNFDEIRKNTPVIVENIKFIAGGSLDLDRYRFLLEKIRETENNKL